MKVLIVDDSVATREIIKRALMSYQYRKLFIRSVESVKKARAELIEWQPHIVLTDWYMPEHTGLVLLEEIRLIRPELPVGVISTIDEKEKIVQARTAGCNFFLSKPFTDEQLHIQLQQIIEKLEQNELKIEQTVPLKEGLPLPKTEQLEKLMQKNISESLSLNPIRAQNFDESKIPSVMVIYAEQKSQKLRVIAVLDVYAVCVLASSCMDVEDSYAQKAIHKNEIHSDILDACKEALEKTSYAFLDSHSSESLYVKSCKIITQAHPRLDQIFSYPLDSRIDLSCEREGMAQGKMLIVGV
ncbi:response regulator [Pseudoalteromonas phenolica]|uniref:Response regulator n=1 Tax=Pseudoalteromonas phenolica TaxID=161398 RepID=A0A4Q7II67_9GAMM|nr:response regulator [Pseudoalteromonas phenolica]RZQ51773.1 response regulator [Pseudoalteromonas phenolica]